MPDAIPITVFTGFLGAGKTSVILSLLPKLPPGYKAVLLKNEFGDLEGEVFCPPQIIIHRRWTWPSRQQARERVKPRRCQ